MPAERSKIRASYARTRGTRVVFPDGTAVQFPRRMSRTAAINAALKARRARQNPVGDPVAQAIAAYEQFNFKAPRELRKLRVDMKTPLIRIGTVPEIHYVSDKEGHKQHYVHFVKRRGTLYAHPSGRFFILAGGSTRVRDWLYD